VTNTDACLWHPWLRINRDQPRPARDAAHPMERIGYGAVGYASSGLRRATHAVRRPRLARDLLHDRHGELTDERDRHRVGANALARHAAGAVEALDNAKAR